MKTLMKLYLCTVLTSVIFLIIYTYAWRKDLNVPLERWTKSFKGLTSAMAQALKYHPDNQDDTKILFSPALNPEHSFSSKTDRKTWDFKSLVECPFLNINDPGKERKNLKISCQKDGPFITYESTSSINITSFPFGNSCVSDIIDKYCNDGKPVPNALHYVWFGKVEVNFHHFLSFMSAARYMKPCLIMFHGDYLPYGKYWDYFTSRYFKIIHLKRPRVTHVYGFKLSFKEHSSDVMRIEAVHKYGGLYIDTDSVILRAVDELRKYNCTMGYVLPWFFGNQFVMAARGAKYLELWHNTYRNYKARSWGHNALYVPKQIAIKHPDLVHVENGTLWRPYKRGRRHIWEGQYNWSITYAMHLLKRFYKAQTDEINIRKLNNSFGSIGRHILYGNKELCS